MLKLKYWFIAAFVLASAVSSSAQGTLADYERARSLQEKFQSAVANMPGPVTWIAGTNSFWYRRTVLDGSEIIRVDADTLAKQPAFDHAKLAAAISSAAGTEFKANRLPLGQGTAFSDQGNSIVFNANSSRWRCDLRSYKCDRAGPVPSGFNTPPQLRLPVPPQTDEPRTSPDKQWEAFIRNFNVFVRSKDGKQEFALSSDGSEGNYYELNSIVWSPDGKKIAAYRVKPGFKRRIHFVESSPLDQMQPKYWSIEYAKPGDTVDIEQPVLFDIAAKRQIDIDNALFPNPYNMTNLVWRRDSRAFTFEYNQRGHQAYRVIEVDAATGTPRAVIEELPKTFFCYSGKRFRQDINDGKEAIWMSERDGWNHLYLFDDAGRIKNQITKGQWVVRGVDRVDEAKRQIYFRAGGMTPGIDPYFVHYYRVNFDGSGLTALTEGNANHAVTLSQDLKFYTDTFSRVDLPTVSQLRSAADGRVLMELEKTDIAELTKAGWRPPEVFTAKGRDGATDIWGVIIRPTNFDPKKTYPVIEYIYAGPHDSFVPKSFSPYSQMQAQAELGFIVVQIDGMGTSNRSKAFHDVAWKNLGDAGFPDRILWHKAVAAKYKYYDISRVGVYGNSAGGQNALGALLFHPEFYKAAVSSAGCHDNRMDKIWWNEQWMGWPLGTEYAAASNVDNAHRLKGKLLLSVGEMDPNVDPASTMQVVNALIKAKKTFDLIVLPGTGHGPGGEYGERKRFDFFVHHLLGVEPPDWNRMDDAAAVVE
ncbi:MAG: DPP IV N-terminal domain-containing protein [Chloracidobacterium sp.]|nr:DPP IV N-terminal domain-containing protein [Chloracidobacterium sp.]